MVGRLLIAIAVLLAPCAKSEPFHFAQMGDNHVNLVSTAGLTNALTWITNNPVVEISGLFLSGDVYQQQATYHPGGAAYDPAETQPDEIQPILGAIYSNGVFVLPAPGNHDADMTGETAWGSPIDESDPEYWSWTNQFPSFFYYDQTNFVDGLGYVSDYDGPDGGDTRQVAMVYTNQGIQFLFAHFSSSWTNINGRTDPEVYELDGVTQYNTNDWLPLNEWMTNQVAAHPNHNTIIQSHYTLARHTTALWNQGPSLRLAQPNAYYRPYPIFAPNDGTGSYVGLGGGELLVTLGLQDYPNTLLFTGGHTRSAQRELIMRRATDGHEMAITAMNYQNATSGTNSHGSWDIVAIYTVDPVRKTLRSRSWSLLLDRWVTDSDPDCYKLFTQSHTGVTFTNYGYHNWTIPLAVPRQQRVFRLR